MVTANASAEAPGGNLGNLFAMRTWHRSPHTMTQYLSLLPLALMGFFPLSAHAQSVEIAVYNQTGYDLDSVSFGQVQLGRIPQEGVLHKVLPDGIFMQGDVPLNAPAAAAAGKPKREGPGPCGTKSRKEITGRYAFDLRIYEADGAHRFYWVKHE